MPAAFRKLAGRLEGRGAFLFLPDPTVLRSRKGYLNEQTVRERMPVIGFVPDPFMTEGAVLAFEPDYHKLGAQAAAQVTQLLANPADGVLPPLFETWVNPTSARILGVRTDYDPDDVREYRQ
jgi:ABC-type uncharacterized transport system substrate-binding protein